MKHNRFFILLVLLPALLFAGCSKGKDGDASNSEYYIRFQINGKEKVFTVNAAAGPKQQAATDGYYHLGMVAGKNAVGINDEMIQISVYKSAPVTSSPGVYTNNGSMVPNITILYVDENAGTWTSIWMTTNNWVADSRVEIKETGDEFVKGTFSSTLYGGDDLELSRKITGGEFYLKLY